MTSLEWWPDWTGQTCVIVASGPSAKNVPLDKGKGRAKFIAINKSWELAPWCDVLYACDLNWWAKNMTLLAGFQGLKVSQDIRATGKKEWDIKLVRTDRNAEALVKKPLGRLGWGGNSGFHCLNLAIQFGCRRILLVGYDMHLDDGIHWHGKHPQGLNNPSAPAIERWRQKLDEIAPSVAKDGVTVLNCSPTSALKAYRKVDFEKALDADSRIAA